MKILSHFSHKTLSLSLTAGLLAASLLTGCGAEAQSAAPAETSEALSASEVVAETAPELSEAETQESAAETQESAVEPQEETSAEAAAPAETAAEPEIVTVANVTSDGVLDATEFFTGRDLTQTPDLSGAETLEVAGDVHITAEGVYVLTGTASNATIYVEAPDDAKVQLVLDGLSITNDDFPCIYVTGADKVFVTTVSDSTLTVTGAFTADGDTNTDGVIFSRSDLVLNGTATLTIDSSENGVVTKDDLKITGGTYNITALSKCLEANDSIRIADGVLNLAAGTDGLHAENGDDETKGYIYICGGTINIDAGDDAVHAYSVLQIDGGAIQIKSAEGLEATYIQINGGEISIEATDDGINGARKSSAYEPTIEINDGYVTVVMGSGDTDGIDSNGDIIINGGTVDVTGRSTFDYDGTGVINGGTVIVNGEQVDTLPNQFMGGGFRR